MLNRVVLVGRLTKDPEYRTTPSGVSVATFTLAVNRTFTNAQGEREADFINCVVFRRQAENVNNYLSKGSLAGVDGRIQSRSYENQEGRRIFGFGGQQSGQNTSYNNNNSSNSNQSDNPFANANGPIDISDDDLPF